MVKEKCAPILKRDPKLKDVLCVKPRTKLCVKPCTIAGKKKSVREARLKKARDDTLVKGKMVQSDKFAEKVSKRGLIPEYDPQPIPLPPHVCEELGIPSYSYPARAYPPYYSGAHYPPPVLNGVLEHPMCSDGAASHRPHVVTAPCPPQHGIIAHALPSQVSTTHDIPSDEVTVKAPPLKFPGVFVRGMRWNCSESDIVRFFHGIKVVDVLPVYTNKSFSGDAFVVFSNTTFANRALRRDGLKFMGSVVGVFPCTRQEYYNFVAASLDAGLDSSNSQSHTKVPNNNYLKEQTDIAKSNAMADASYPEHPQGQTMSLCDNNTDHGQPEGEAKSLLNNDKPKPKPKPKRKRKSKSLSDKNLPILRVCGPPYFADTNVITSVFWEFDLSEDRIHIVLHPNEKPTGEMFLEFASLEDTRKALLKDKTMIGSHQLKILPATVEDLQVKNTERKQELVGHDTVKEFNNEPKFPDGHASLKKSDDEPSLADSNNCVKESNDEPVLSDSHLHGKPKISDDTQTGNTKVVKMRNVPRSADKYDIIELFGEFKLSLDRLHVVCQRNGMATGVVYVEFESAEDAKNALSKHRSKIHSQCVFLFLSSKEEAMHAMNGKW